MTAFIDDLKDLLPDTVLVAPRLSVDAKGKATYGDDIEYLARITKKSEQVNDAGGLEVASKVQILIAGVGFTVYHRYTLPVRFDPRRPFPLSVRPATDEDGPSHERVFFR